MSIEGIKTEFYNYLKDSLKATGDKNKKDKLGDLSDFSIFKYSKEFKEFLTDEYNASSDVLSMSITDILKLEIKNGKIIKEEDDKSGSEDPTADTTDPKADKAPDMVDILNLMMEDEEFKNIFDENEDGEISDNEFKSFLDTVKELDEDEKDISLDDIIKAADNDNQDPTDPNDTPAGNTPTPTSGGGGGGGYGGGGGGYSGGGSSNGVSGDSSGSTSSAPSENNSQTTSSNIDYTQYSSEDLRPMIEAQEGIVSLKENNLTELQNEGGVIDELKQDSEDKYNDYIEALEAQDDQASREILEATKTVKAEEDAKNETQDTIDINKALIETEEQNITNQEDIISNCETAIDQLNGNISTLTALKNSTDDEGEKAKYEAQIQDARKAIAEQESQIGKAEEAIRQSENLLTEYNANLGAAEAELEVIDQNLTEAQNNLADLEEQYKDSESVQAVQDQKRAYEESKDLYETSKSELIEAAKQEVIIEQKKLADMNTALSQVYAEETDQDTGEESELLAEIEGIDKDKKSENEEDENSEEEKSIVDELCERLNINRCEVGIYLENITNKNNLSPEQLYDEINKYLESEEAKDEQIAAEQEAKEKEKEVQREARQAVADAARQIAYEQAKEALEAEEASVIHKEALESDMSYEERKENINSHIAEKIMDSIDDVAENIADKVTNAVMNSNEAALNAAEAVIRDEIESGEIEETEAEIETEPEESEDSVDEADADEVETDEPSEDENENSEDELSDAASAAKDIIMQNLKPKETDDESAVDETKADEEVTVDEAGTEDSANNEKDPTDPLTKENAEDLFEKYNLDIEKIDEIKGIIEEYTDTIADSISYEDVESFLEVPSNLLMLKLLLVEPEPVEESAEDTVEEATEEPIEEPTEEDTVEEATEEPVEKPKEEATEDPVDEEPVEPIEDPAEEPTEEPTEETK